MQHATLGKDVFGGIGSNVGRAAAVVFSAMTHILRYGTTGLAALSLNQALCPKLFKEDSPCVYLVSLSPIFADLQI